MLFRETLPFSEDPPSRARISRQKRKQIRARGGKRKKERKFSEIKAAAAAMCICSEPRQKPRVPVTSGQLLDRVSEPGSLAQQVLTLWSLPGLAAEKGRGEGRGLLRLG